MRSTTDETASKYEIDALIYQQSCTAKARAAVSGKAKAKRTVPNEESGDASPLKKMHKQSRRRKKCSHAGCTTYAIRGEVCMRHGVKRKEYSHDGCTENSQRGGLYIRHGTMHKRCSHEGFSNRAIKGGVCMRPEGKIKK